MTTRSAHAWPLWVLLFLTSALCVGSASAQELPSIDLSRPCAPEVPEERRRASLARSGDVGVWFHIDVASCMVQRLAVLPTYVERVSLLQERIEASSHLLDTLTTAELLSRQIAETATGALTAAERARRRAEEELGAWYRSPVLWFSVGAIVVAAIVVGLLVGVQ
ncbi:MAG: DUF5129 domain-containing protein [Acidobacteriota bacterium]|nr:DUF5129 domain-containing protein [Acidobacteriota bacterium]